MAVYKVAQDVEADDKLIGPFSFRQFIYLIIVALAIAVAWGLSRIFLPLALLPLPVIIFFGTIALPLKKDQPMEVYMAAIVSFYLKPRKRIWKADGVKESVEITAPKTVEKHRTKDISQLEAERRLSYLADVVDTKGWSVRGVNEGNNAMINDVYFAAQQAEDILDDSGGVAYSFDTMIEKADKQRRQAMIDKMKQATTSTTVQQPQQPQQPQQTQSPATTVQPQQTQTAGSNSQQETTNIHYEPYPSSMHQTVIQPPVHEKSTSEKNTSHDMMDMLNKAKNSANSVTKNQQESNSKKDLSSEGEVTISLH